MRMAIMSDVSRKEVAKATRGYVEAVDNYHRLLDKYFPVRRVLSGVALTPGEPITETALKELEEAEAKVIETRKKWRKLIGL
jgi:hypothetical protein